VRLACFLLLLAIAANACAETDCQVIEYPDRYEVDCTGDPVTAPVSSPSQQPVKMLHDTSSSSAVQSRAKARTNMPALKQETLEALKPRERDPSIPPDSKPRGALD
jgi:hypothetical protein